VVVAVVGNWGLCGGELRNERARGDICGRADGLVRDVAGCGPIAFWKLAGRKGGRIFVWKHGKGQLDDPRRRCSPIAGEKAAAFQTSLPQDGSGLASVDDGSPELWDVKKMTAGMESRGENRQIIFPSNRSNPSKQTRYKNSSQSSNLPSRTSTHSIPTPMLHFMCNYVNALSFPFPSTAPSSIFKFPMEVTSPLPSSSSCPPAISLPFLFLPALVRPPSARFLFIPAACLPSLLPPLPPPPPKVPGEAEYSATVSAPAVSAAFASRFSFAMRSSIALGVAPAKHLNKVCTVTYVCSPVNPYR